MKPFLKNEEYYKITYIKAWWIHISYFYGNTEKYILRFIRNIQNQFFENIEIILVDDFSLDNSKKIIEKLQKDDERIALIKHKNNKGTLISRKNGILKSKGKYIIIPDSDDIR